jgi:hypothetical protein
VSVGSFVVFPQDATIEYKINLGARDLRGWVVDFKCIPIADPEVEPPAGAAPAAAFRDSAGETGRVARPSIFAKRTTIKTMPTLNHGANDLILISLFVAQI